MKCTQPAFDHEFANLPCLNEATWEGRCPMHGGKVPTVQELMILLGKLTGSGDQGLSVAIGYKRARVWDAQAESHLDENVWGFTAETRTFGQAHDVHAQGQSLEEALWALCKKVAGQATRDKERAATRVVEVDRVLGEFVRSRHAS